jgi:hypothetical protein
LEHDLDHGIERAVAKVREVAPSRRVLPRHVLSWPSSMKKSTPFATSHAVSMTAVDFTEVFGGTVIQIAGAGNHSNTAGRTVPLPPVPNIGVGNL